MTVAELQAIRDEIVKTIGRVRDQFGDRSVEYSRQQDALALIDMEIAKVGGSVPRISIVQHSRD